MKKTTVGHQEINGPNGQEDGQRTAGNGQRTTRRTQDDKQEQDGQYQHSPINLSTEEGKVTSIIPMIEKTGILRITKKINSISNIWETGFGKNKRAKNQFDRHSLGQSTTRNVNQN
jgi:hypothetical protein